MVVAISIISTHDDVMFSLLGMLLLLSLQHVSANCYRPFRYCYADGADDGGDDDGGDDDDDDDETADGEDDDEE